MTPLLWDGQVLHTPGGYSEDNSGTNLYAEPDALGSSAGVLSSSDGTDATYEYDAFGNVMGGSGSLPVSYPFDQGFGAGVGYTEEAGTGGLVRCGNRYYNPYFGRFLTQDPSGDGLNWYAYCDNDPTDAFDPSGTSAWGNIASLPDDDTGDPDDSGDSDDSGTTNGKHYRITVIHVKPVVQNSYWNWVKDHFLESLTTVLAALALHRANQAYTLQRRQNTRDQIEQTARIDKDVKAARAARPKMMTRGMNAARATAASNTQAADKEQSASKITNPDAESPQQEQQDAYRQQQIQQEQDLSNAGRGSTYRGVPTNTDDENDE